MTGSSKERSTNNKITKGKTSKQTFAYRSAGVDLEKASRALELIKRPVFDTFNENVLNDLTAFGGLFRLEKNKFREPVLVSSTDGVGTKLLIAKETGVYDCIGQDLVGMCTNDILCCGATPLFFLDYIACGKLDPGRIRTIVSSIAKSCKNCESALIGGEVAEMPGLYSEDDIDLAGFAVGVVERKDILNPGRVSVGDAVLGIPSSGIHSNGFSLIRKIIEDRNLKLNKKYDIRGRQYNLKNLGEILLTPTRLYHRILKKIRSMNIKINSMAHITGGGFYENINRIIPDSMNAEVIKDRWEVPGIFDFFQKLGGIADKEMFRVFNMGIGMVLITGLQEADKIKSAFASGDEKIIEIGAVIEGKGKVILK